MNTKQLAHLMWQAEQGLRDLHNERHAKRVARIEAATKLIDAELAPEYDARLAELNESWRAAKSALEKSQVADGIKESAYPVGTELAGWKQARQYGWGPNNNPFKLVAKGIVEIVTPDTVFPANWKYSVPSVGTCIVRLLDKNGRPGKKVETLNHYRGHKWLKPGIVPEGAKVTA